MVNTVEPRFRGHLICKIAWSQDANDGNIDAWSHYPRVKQNWLPKKSDRKMNVLLYKRATILNIQKQFTSNVFFPQKEHYFASSESK